MAYNSLELFNYVSSAVSKNPSVRLYQLAKQLGCSHPTIEKAVSTHANLSFREFQQQMLLEKALHLFQQGYNIKDIGFALGYRWPENFSRFVTNSLGCPFSKLMMDR